MLGSVHTTGGSNASEGLYFSAVMDIFRELQHHPGLRVGVSLFEIYGGKLYDLFNDRQLVKCLEDAQGQIHFRGLSERKLKSPYDVMGWIHEGSSKRSTGTTSRNADSSRSHAVLQLHLRRISDDSEFSRMTVIDLAGSERGADTSAACRTTRIEGAEINTSLLALKEVIRALAKGDSISHVPFRGSKLTQVLKESFVGSNCRSVMIACVSPNIGNCEQTLNTLRYANRVKERNPETGETTTDAVIMYPGESTASQTLSDSENRVLDELLSSNRSLQQNVTSTHSLQPAVHPEILMENPLHAANELIESHRQSMEDVLGLNQVEMRLSMESDVCTEEYLRTVEKLHSEQLQICQNLRQRIGAYRRARAAVVGGTDDLVHDGDTDDESVEDLRD